MTVTLATDDATVDRALALEFFATFGGVPGPDLSDPLSTFQVRRLSRFGTPTHDAARSARRRGVRCQLSPATLRDAAPHDEVGALTLWSANGPPASPGA